MNPQRFEQYKDSVFLGGKNLSKRKSTRSENFQTWASVGGDGIDLIVKFSKGREAPTKTYMVTWKSSYNRLLRINVEQW